MGGRGDDGRRATRSPRIELRDAVLLATAVVARALSTAGISYLVFKGPISVDHGVRADRPSTDVDILVRTRDLALAEKVLGDLGWLGRPSDPNDLAFPVHSRAFVHPSWPCDVDVHFRIPGIELAPDQAFEQLLAQSRQSPCCGALVTHPGRLDSALLVALHSARTSHQPTAAQDTAAIGEALDDRDLGEVVTRARDLDALPAVWPVLQTLHAPGLSTVRPPVSHAWAILEATQHSASVRLIHLLDSPVHQWPTLLRRALVPSRAALASVDLTATTGTLSRRRLTRIRQAWRRWPEIIGDLRSYRSLRRRHD